jgi:hypothetical protein
MPLFAGLEMVRVVGSSAWACKGSVAPPIREMARMTGVNRREQNFMAGIITLYIL